MDFGAWTRLAVLTSLHNPRVKVAARLRERKGRDEQRRIIIDGMREIGLALSAGVRIIELYFVAELCQADPHAALLRRAERAGIERIEVAPQHFRAEIGDRRHFLVKDLIAEGLRAPHFRG